MNISRKEYYAHSIPGRPPEMRADFGIRISYLKGKDDLARSEITCQTCFYGEGNGVTWLGRGMIK